MPHVAVAVAEVVASLAAEVPVFGSVFAALQKLADAADKASVNKRACERVSVWSVAVQAALEGAAPAIMAAGEDARQAESFSVLLDAFESQIGALRAMTQSYTNKRYIVRVLTSGQFKSRFEETTTVAKELLDAVSLVMQSTQLQLAANNGSGLFAAADSEKAFADFKAKMDKSMSITVEIDEKLDALVAMQAELLEEQKKQSKMQGKTEVKIDALLDIVISLSANGAHAPAIVTFDFEITCTMGQQINMSDPMTQGITTHGRAATHWSIVAEGAAAKSDVLTEAEFRWLGAYLSRAMDHNFGFVNCMQVMSMGPVIMDTLSPKLIEAGKTAASALRWGDRNVELAFKRMSADVMTGKALYTISWPANGLKPRADDFDVASLPTIPAKQVQEAKAPKMQEEGVEVKCCAIL
eukprot:m.211982 g.211982  ORF g.211982 m.211982 type:complete len:411 (+) comp25831_c0_seq1:122-1354(+)